MSSTLWFLPKGIPKDVFNSVIAVMLLLHLYACHKGSWLWFIMWLHFC